MRILENLTPGGSEYFNDPERCAKWIEDRLSNAQRITVEAVKDRNAALARAEQAEAREAVLREALRLAAVRLDICTGRMRGCHEKTGNHELLDEAEMFVSEARAALAATATSAGE